LSCSGYFADFVFLVSVVAGVMKLVLQGYIPASTGSMILLGLVAFRASARIFGGGISHFVRLTCRVAIPVASVLTIFIGQTNPASLWLILGTYGVFWLGFAPVLMRNRHWFWVLLPLSSVFVWLFYLAGQGYIPPEIFYLAFLVFLVAGVFARVGGSLLVRKVWGIGVPVASLVILAGILGGGNWKAVGQVLSALLVLLLVLVGLYIIVTAPFRR
jgi:hypothetical protein